MADVFAPTPGDCVSLQPGLRRILAANPSMMTQHGTNTYILGTGTVAVIDPGPMIEGHLAAILAGLAPGERISHILVTHAHLDHSGLARRLAQASGARIYAYGDAGAGRSPVMQRLAGAMSIGGGEGVDHAFQPDVALADGAGIDGGTWAVEAIHTPGHMGNHLCFAFGDNLFCGDHIMGWSSSLISPPDGDMADYMASLTKIALRQWNSLFPGHGAVITSPASRIADLISHRRARETALIKAMHAGRHSIAAMASHVYPDLSPALVLAARRNILAHLIDLTQQNTISAAPYLREDATFTVL